MTGTILDDLTDDLVADAHSELEGLVVTDGHIKGFHVPDDEKWRLVPDFARDKDYPFFRSAVNYTLEKVIEYAKIKKENEADKEKKAAWDKVAFDIDKSDLLERLLSGLAPLDVPPPKTFKANWYELIESGVGIPQKVKFSKYTGGMSGTESWHKDDEYAIIDEYAWKIIKIYNEEEADERSFIVKHHDSYKAPKFVLRKATDEEIKTTLHPREYRATADNIEWILEREED